MAQRVEYLPPLKQGLGLILVEKRRNKYYNPHIGTASLDWLPSQPVQPRRQAPASVRDLSWKIMWKKAGETAQWVRCLPHTHEDMSVNLQHPHKAEYRYDLLSQCLCSKMVCGQWRISKRAQACQPGVCSGKGQRALSKQDGR